MKEYNFKNCDKKLEDGTLVFYQNIISSEEVKFDNSSIIYNNLESKTKVTANYSLIVFGDINVKELNVKKDLICFGKIKCEGLVVSGKLNAFGWMDIKTNIYVGNNSIVYTGQINKGTFKRDLILTDLVEVKEELNVSGNLINPDNVWGNGANTNLKDSKDSNITLNISEILSNLNKQSKETLDNIKENMDLESFANSIEVAKYIKNKELTTYIIEKLIPSLNRLEIHEIKEILKKIEMIDPAIENNLKAISILEKLIDDDNICNLDDYIRYIDIFRSCEDYMLQIELFKYVLDSTLKNKKRYISDMKLDNIKTNKDFAGVIYLLERNKSFFSESEYLMILEKLYGKLGVTLNLIKQYIHFS